MLSVMATAGLYDDSGKWLVRRPGSRRRVASAAASSPSSPGKFGIAVISPPLDKAGNSVRGQRAITDIGTALRANPYYTSPK